LNVLNWLHWWLNNRCNRIVQWLNNCLILMLHGCLQHILIILFMIVNICILFKITCYNSFIKARLRIKHMNLFGWLNIIQLFLIILVNLGNLSYKINLMKSFQNWKLIQEMIIIIYPLSSFLSIKVHSHSKTNCLFLSLFKTTSLNNNSPKVILLMFYSFSIILKMSYVVKNALSFGETF
jgi:hypothetical protein